MRPSSLIIIATWLALAVAPAAAQSEVAGQCFCDNGGGIAINQLIRAVNVALGSAACPAASTEVAGECFCDAGGGIAINQVIRAVNIALGSAECPPPPVIVTSPTSTAVATSTVTATATEAVAPSATHTGPPTATSTAVETVAPSATHTDAPTATRTATEPAAPSATHTGAPTATRTATEPTAPSATHTGAPTATRTATEPAAPSATHTDAPTPTRTATQPLAPSATHTEAPTATPTATPTVTSTATAVSTRFGENGTTVVDFQTGLEWVKTDDLGGIRDKDRTFTWSASGTAPDGTVFTEYLATLNSTGVGGHHDWRLPTGASFGSSGALHAAELEAIVDCSHTPCLDPAFGPTVGALYWTSATVPEIPSAASSVHFGNGFASFDGKNLALAVRAVRGGGVPPPRFNDTGLTVIDRVNELEWVKSDDSGGLTDVDDVFTWGLTESSDNGTLATTYLANLNNAAFAGHSDWRLPSSAGNGGQPVQPAELESILDCSYAPCIHPLFGPAKIGYWSSTVNLGQPATVLAGGLTNGDIFNLNRTQQLFARAVRNVPRATAGLIDFGLTIVDFHTGLEWVKTDDAGGLTDKDRTFTWSASGVVADGTVFSEYLAGLNATKYAGHDDWRLPTNTVANLPIGQTPELSSIVDCGFPSCLDPTFGPVGGGEIYWSSTSNPHFLEVVLVTVFDDTGVSGDIGKTIAAHARAVRRGPTVPPPRFVDAGFTVIDRATKLEWAKSDDAGGITDKDRTFTWSATGTAADGTAFTQYVAALNTANYGGHADWRLPSSAAGENQGPLQAAELESIADCSYPKCLHPIFGPIAGGTYWSSSTNPDAPTAAFGLSFVDGGNAGSVLSNGKSVPKHVRAVRSGP